MAMKKNKVLIVDDQPGMTETLADILEDEGCEVILATNGIQAIQRIAEHRVDMVLMDVIMPGMNGVETFRKLKQMRPHTPVVMMTGYQVEHLIKDAVREGSVAVLQKPVDPGLLVGIVINTLQQGMQ
jgi:two-component system nitrogen regulation response regulator NtrX